MCGWETAVDLYSEVFRWAGEFLALHLFAIPVTHSHVNARRYLVRAKRLYDLLSLYLTTLQKS